MNRPVPVVLRLIWAAVGAAVIFAAVGAAGVTFWGAAVLALVGLAALALAGTRSMSTMIGASIALLLFLLMALVIHATPDWRDNEAPAQSANDDQTLVDTMFGNQVIALEVLGILLTAAMIGALVIARPMDAEPDESHYHQPTAAQLTESQNSNDPKMHPTEVAK
jgi:NADH:ubiquinone oxidoreductase subunit 6 (subunit J)